MKQLNFLSKSSSQSCGYRVTTLALTVGSPSVHRRGIMLKLLSVLVLIFTFGCGEMWGTDPNVVYTFNSNAGIQELGITKPDAGKGTNLEGPYAKSPVSMSVTHNSTNGTRIWNSSGTLDLRIYKDGGSLTFTISNGYKITSIVCAGNAPGNFTYDGEDGTFTSGTWTEGDNKTATSVTLTANNTAKINTITVYYQTTCSNSVSISAGTPTNATISVGATSLQTCSSTATDRQVTVSVAPAICYAAPVAASVTWTGTAASKTTRKSGPTWNSTTSKYDYVFEFDKDATGAVQFNISLSTKTTYTVNYNKGTYGSGGNDSGTKTCGETLTLPNSAMFTREGYTQKGWSTAPAGNTKTYNLGGNYTNNSATTLYPYWEANDCTITWVVNGEPWDQGGSTTAKYDGKVANLPTAPNTTNDGCGDKFMGWTNVNIEDAVLDKDVPADATTISTLNCFTDVDGSPVIQGTTTFYAVFAEYVEK